MRRLVWLAAGPLLILALGAGLILGMDEEDSKLPTGKSAMILPSGLEAHLQEMIWNAPGEGLAYRFRFVAPEFEQTEDVEKVMSDLHHLCTEYAVPRLSEIGPAPGQVVVSLADQPSEFGTYNPDVTQVFEAFELQDGACIWGVF